MLWIVFLTISEKMNTDTETLIIREVLIGSRLFGETNEISFLEKVAIGYVSDSKKTDDGVSYKAMTHLYQTFHPRYELIMKVIKV